MTSNRDAAQQAHEAMEKAWREADHLARVTARLLYDGEIAEARAYSARYVRAAAEAHRLLDLATAAAQADTED